MACEISLKSRLEGAASNPFPVNDAIDIDPNNVVLSWTAGIFADSHDVYLGTDFNDVNNADILSPEFKGNQTAASYDPCDLDINTTYFWRIDEKNLIDTTKGNVWNFQTTSDPNLIGLIGWWKFDEGSGTIANDSAGSPSNGTVYGAAWITGKINGALNFDGSNDYVEISGANDVAIEFNKNSRFTISCWAKPLYAQNGYLVCKMRASAQYNVFGYTIAYGSGGLFRFTVESSRAGSAITATASGSAPAGNWYHVVAVYNNTQMAIYMDGLLKDTATFTRDPGTTFPDKNMVIGARSYDSTVADYFNGLIDDVRIYNRVLSDTEIQQLYCSSQKQKQALFPNPVDGATNVSLTQDISWYTGYKAISHDVYFGTVNPPPFIGNQAGTTYDTGTMAASTTYYWRIDEKDANDTIITGDIWSFTTVPPPPGAASNPNPADSAADVSPTQDLSWTAGSDATSHDVYFGTVNPPPFIRNQTATTYDTGTMATGTVYYWRIDEKGLGGTTTGTVWSFTTGTPLPGAASNPSPVNGDVNVDPNNVVLSWTADVLADSYDVYLGTDFNDVNDANTSSPEFKGNQTAASYDPCDLDLNTTYFWRIDEKNSYGNTKGNVWNFQTTSDPNLIGLIGWWKFDEGSGTIANDSAGDSNGTVYGGAAWTTGQVNGALSFDISNDYVGVPDSDNSLDMDNQMTISAWVKVNNLSNYHFIVTKQPSGVTVKTYPGNYEFRIEQTSGNLVLLHQTTTGFTLTSYYSTSTVTAGVWQHVAVTLEEGVAVKFYINGAPAGTLPQTTTFGIVNNEPVRIGARKDGYPYFNGAIDDVRIYNRVLSDGEIQQLYQSGL